MLAFGADLISNHERDIEWNAYVGGHKCHAAIDPFGVIFWVDKVEPTYDRNKDAYYQCNPRSEQPKGRSEGQDLISDLLSLSCSNEREMDHEN